MVPAGVALAELRLQIKPEPKEAEKSFACDLHRAWQTPTPPVQDRRPVKVQAHYLDVVVGQKYVAKMACPGKWKRGNMRSPGGLILTHTQCVSPKSLSSDRGPASHIATWQKGIKFGTARLAKRPSYMDRYHVSHDPIQQS